MCGLGSGSVAPLARYCLGWAGLGGYVTSGGVMTHVSCWAELGWAGLGWAGWAGLQQLPSQHRDNTPDLGIARAALAGSDLDLHWTSCGHVQCSHCASSAASKLCIVERSAGVHSVLICGCQHSALCAAQRGVRTANSRYDVANFSAARGS